MENWGLITFRDSSLLVPDEEDKMSSAQHTEYVASIISHEIAHQWFGNLVTPKNWEDLWLKEGFASYLSTLAIHNIYTNWRRDPAFHLCAVIKLEAINGYTFTESCRYLAFSSFACNPTS
uniref:Peptidase M1 membrane alanine aminopeptidase domain-containing protein n=1 Tax=Megaselia scalaris TaxID=36166 RepID=T1GTJ7_MEGSC